MMNLVVCDKITVRLLAIGEEICNNVTRQMEENSELIRVKADYIVSLKSIIKHYHHNNLKLWLIIELNIEL